jgi:transcriptional regulator with XRE-family HTH domain
MTPRAAVGTIGQRLRQERERLGMNQTDFAEVGGASKRAQIRYEADERSPDAHYLAAIAKAGADILFFVTGKKR